MPTRRLISLALATCLLFASAPALAQSETEVEAARQELADARSRLASDRLILEAADGSMMSSIQDFNGLSSQLEQASFAFAQLQEDVLATEVEITVQKVEVAWLIRDAYVDAMLAGPAASLSTEVLDEVVVASDIMSRVASHRSQVAIDFEHSRDQLDEARAEMEEARDLLTGLRERAEIRMDEAIQGANAAAGMVNATTAAEAEATSAFQDAVDRLEAALRSVPPRTLRWRPLVLQYFPEELQWQALEIIQCESSGREKVVNPEADAVGLFQFLPAVWELASEGAGFPGADRADPEASIAAAAWLVQKTLEDNHPDGPWGRWNCKPRS